VSFILGTEHLRISPAKSDWETVLRVLVTKLDLLAIVVVGDPGVKGLGATLLTLVKKSLQYLLGRP
jgi:hypothetical protein